ncbi:conserved hypothetical protein [Vibrio coralliirubri]|uniref:GTP pyrophosphokinase n=1 Tax=Vibrio coralliirubri TaxID=1516159 RepID=UPI00063A06DF|nr:hypothetical protein [Vibrio coralliirubri]CDT56400.1 conserved hypothetical protein [Vibrio coralliirubri]
MGKKEILAEFDAKANVLLSLESMTSSLLQALVSQDGVQIHSITSRTKQRESLVGKIGRPDKSYENLLEITDVVGFRITTYFSEDVDNIAELIEKEFSIDRENSIDKRKSLEPDRFGYMSLHLVGQHKNSRLKLPEYKHFKSIKFEIQIRSILQHAWAEIEHDIGYKSTKEVPDELKRRFSRLAGLLELADEEFQSIKNGIEYYRSNLPEQVNSSPDDVSLNLESLTYFVNTNDKVKALENEMLSVFNCEELTPAKDRNLAHNLEFLNRMEIFTLGQLIDKIEEVSSFVVPFLKVWISEPRKSQSISRGISLLYLTYINLAMQDDMIYSEYVLGAAPFDDISSLAADIQETWSQLKI